ncbi:MAG: DUF1501 domain-containing protein [Candidatus Kapaibacterium sp.]
MKRRDFLKAAAPATILPFLVGGFSVKAFANNPFFQTLIPENNPSDRILVLIQLIGGNDGLQTVIPLDQYVNLMAARANIIIPEKNTLKLTDTIGLHPNFSGMQNLFNDGKLAIVQNVGYPQPNFSHFRSIDIWLSGANYDELLTTGWLGRYLDQEYPGFPAGYPNAPMPDPIAIQIGASVSLGLQGQNGSMGMVFSDPSSFNDIVNDTVTPTQSTRAGHELAYIRSIGQQLQTFAAPVKTAYGKGKVLSSKWPATGGNTLADQLQIVSQLIEGGLKTKIYVVNLGGFDSHTDQRANQDPLLLKVSDAISAFQDELKLNALEDRVIGMTFSEFGRRIISNDSLGSDHGAAAPMFLFGTQVIAGMHGNNPVIPSKVTVDDNLPMEFDFRQIYASVLKEWLGTSDAEIAKTLLNTYQTIPIIKQQSTAVTKAPMGTTDLLQNYPNPCKGVTNIAFKTLGGNAALRIFDAKGVAVTTLLDGPVVSGERTISFDASALPSGSYFYRLESGGLSLTKEMVVVR